MINKNLMDAVAVPSLMGEFTGPAEIFTAVLIVVVIVLSVVKIIRVVNKKKKNNDEDTK
ncbi:MAG: hypothetical protein IJA55_06275 [Clostridia bacterium]|nr:hypothetical protein [Clostridia bacterium]MBQ4602765.1 hypothetical protein [Clostridia bacterium]